MRTIALVAFLALQMSMFTCGFDIHVHATDSDLGHVAEHVHDKAGDHEKNSVNHHGCHLHASHTLAVSDVDRHGKILLLPTVHFNALANLNLKKLPFLIEHPPKLQYS
jgi:hypothetical protein